MTKYFVEYYTFKARTPYKRIECWLPNGERPKFIDTLMVITANDNRAKGFCEAIKNAPPVSYGKTVIKTANGVIVGGLWMDKNGNKRIKWKTSVKASSPLDIVDKAFAEAKKQIKM